MSFGANLTNLIKKPVLKDLEKARLVRDKSVNNKRNGFDNMQPEEPVDKERYKQMSGRRGKR